MLLALNGYIELENGFRVSIPLVQMSEWCCVMM